MGQMHQRPNNGKMLVFNHKIVETHLPLFVKVLTGAKESKYYYGKAHPEQGHSQIRSQQTCIITEMICTTK